MNYKEALTSKYIAICKKERNYKDELRTLPKGYLQKKIIKGKEYFYLQYRLGKKVKSKYVKKLDIEDIIELIDRRKELEIELQTIKKEKQAIETLLNKDELLLAYIKKSVLKVVKSYPIIKRIALFGSRANSNYKDDSDVDLIFESKEPISFLIQSEIRNALEDEIGLSVDLVHGPIKNDSFLKIDKEIELYAT